MYFESCDSLNIVDIEKNHFNYMCVRKKRTNHAEHFNQN